MDFRFRLKVENNWSYEVLHEVPFVSVLAASAATRLLPGTSTFSLIHF